MTMKKNKTYAEKEKPNYIEGFFNVIILLLGVAVVEGMFMSAILFIASIFADALQIWGGSKGVRAAVFTFAAEHNVATIVILAAGYLVLFCYVCSKTVNLLCIYAGEQEDSQHEKK